MVKKWPFMALIEVFDTSKFHGTRAARSFRHSHFHNKGQNKSHSNTDCLNSLVQKRADFEYFQNLSCLFKRFEKWTDTGNKFNFRRSRKREYVRILASSWMFWTILRSGLRTSDWVFHMYIQTMHRNLLSLTVFINRRIRRCHVIYQ